MDLAALGRVHVTGLDGRQATIASFWARRAVVLVFVRHFG